MGGRDEFIIVFWRGLFGMPVLVKGKSEPDEIIKDIKTMAHKYGVPYSNIAVDADGMGEYIRGFILV